MAIFSENVAELATIDWFAQLGYEYRHGPSIAPGETNAERADYRESVLGPRLISALDRLNPDAPAAALEDAERRLLAASSSSLVIDNRRAHRMLVDGVEVEVARPEGIRGEQIRVIAWDEPDLNDWLVVNQFTIKGRSTRRADVVVFVNGLPLAVMELKDPADEDATIWTAFRQFETYKQEIPELFTFNELLIISDGDEARLGSLTSERERFAPWRTVHGREVTPGNGLEVLVRGVFDKARFLQLIRRFVVYEEERGRLAKKIAGYHQFHATRKAIATTLRAASGDGRAGVVWHTQGSGKSLTMLFYAGHLIAEPALANPTIVVLTDRNDLDDQLFGVFSRCAGLLRQTPRQAQDRAELRRLLSVTAGGVIFTTIQKFLPESSGDSFARLTDRRNVVVIADEAHRSQYGFIAGYARHLREGLPNATFVAFTGTPIEGVDHDTRAVFGDYIDVYDIARAVEDGATVPIFYESRLAKLDLRSEERPRIDEEFEEVTEAEEIERRERLKTKWAQLEAVVGTQRRLALVAEDLITHFESRLGAMDGKAMVVCMSRRIAAALYDEIVRLRPQWHATDDADGVVKVAMTGSASDPVEWQQHIRNKQRREALAERFKDPASTFRVALVRDMWLTGFDVPSLHTMYVDKPMRGHGLMQSIARVNRVYRDKPGGLIVDYIGLADSLRRALADYTQSGGQGKTAIDQDEAVRAMQTRYEVCRDMFHGFDYLTALGGSPAERMALLPKAQDHIVAPPNGQDRFVAAVSDLSRAFALAVPRPEALAVRAEVQFFQTVKARLVKTTLVKVVPEYELDHAIRQIVDKAIAPEGVMDIFEAAGLKRPDISILEDRFLGEVRQMPQRNLAVELLRRLLHDEIKVRARKNLVQSHSFAEMLEQAIRRYQARAIEAAQVIEELIAIAKEMKAAQARGEQLGLSDEELAFYDALGTNDSAVAVLGDETLRAIARELTETVRRNATIDWTVKDDVRANLRRLVRRILKRHGYPPDKQEAATQTVIAQAELLGWDLTEPEAPRSAT